MREPGGKGSEMIQIGDMHHCASTKQVCAWIEALVLRWSSDEGALTTPRSCSKVEGGGGSRDGSDASETCLADSRTCYQAGGCKTIWESGTASAGSVLCDLGLLQSSDTLQHRAEKQARPGGEGAIADTT